MIKENLHRRLNARVVMGLYFAMSAIIVVRLVAMQVFSTSYYRQASLANSARIVPIRAPRGQIYDRNGETIVRNRPSYSLYVLPYRIADTTSTAGKLAEILGMDRDYITSLEIEARGEKYRPIRLRRDIDFKTLSIIEEHSLEFPGVVFQSEMTRQYPERGFGSHFLGHIGEVSEKELEQYPDYQKGDLIGKKGLEKYYDSYLRGRDGLSYLEVTARGQVLGRYPGKEDIPPISGATLNLNIDWPLQQLADRILDSAGQGGIVIIDVNNGGVLTLASSPEFDANLFSGFMTPQTWSQIAEDPRHPLLNRAIQATYPPGSTMKVFTAAMGLYFDKIDAQTSFDPCRGQKRFGNRVFKCWRPSGHGRLTLHEAIVQSCDIYFYQLGLLCGIESWEKFMPMCRFGIPTGIDIPGEKSGNSPSVKYYDNRYGKDGWTKTFVINLAIGQGEMLVTPLQMAVLYAALANGGIVYKPRLVNSIVDAYGNRTDFPPQVVAKLPIKDEDLRLIVGAMIGVTEEWGGTARIVQIPGISIAGKTGTAQNPHGNDHAWFICFAPVDKPEIAISIIVENAGHGGSVAAPLARILLEHYFHISGKEPT